MSEHNEMAAEDLLLESYRAALESKHHYDVLSWTVGGGTLVFVAAALAFIPGITGDGYGWTVLMRVPIALFAGVLLVGWHRVYERNRLWGEVANAFMQKIERAQRVEGIAIAFMKAHLDKGVQLGNTDEHGNAYNGNPPHYEKSHAGSMHGTVKLIVYTAIFIVLVVCLFPQASPSDTQHPPCASVPTEH